LTLDRLESLLKILGGIAGISTLAIAIVASAIALRRAPAREEPAGRLLLRAPITLVASAAFMALAILGWRILPLHLAPPLRAVASPTGALLLFSGVALYHWGLLSLRSMSAPSSGFAARIQAARNLITSGP
jgi:multisubunit Na+/H+ antiporter MnhB subunit